MWVLFRLKKEFDKIKESFKKTKENISKNSEEIKVLKENSISKKEVDLMIREALLKVQFEQNSELKSEPTKETKFEATMIQKARKNRPELLKTAIRGFLARNMKTTEIFNIIVLEKKICGKTQFYHYLSLVKSELRTELRPELRTKLK